MRKLKTIVLGITLLMFFISGVYAYVGYSGSDVLDKHYMIDGKWSESVCGGCHYNADINPLANDAEGSYHVQTDMDKWTPLDNFHISEQGKDEWVKEFGPQHPGGGPLEEYGVGLDCMICHDQTGEYDFDKRAEMIRSGNYEDADSAAWGEERQNLRQEPHYVGSYLLDVLTPLPIVAEIHDSVLGSSQRSSCEEHCHADQVETTGVNWADENYSEFDVHAEESCVECHETIEHQIGSSTMPAAQEVGAEVQSCQSSGCHEGISHGGTVDAHLEFLECQSCHVTEMPGGESQGGAPLEEFTWKNGTREDKVKMSSFKPTLGWSTNYSSTDKLPHSSSMDVEGAKLTSYSVITGIWWDSGTNEEVASNPNNSTTVGNPIPPSHVSQADANDDGNVTQNEMRSFDSNDDGVPDYPNAILRHVDLHYPINHNIAGSDTGLSDPLECGDCHGASNTEQLQNIHFDEKIDDCSKCHTTKPTLDWDSLGYESDPAGEGNFSEIEINVTAPGERPEEVEKDPAF
ncbi:MAG: methanogenesis multiheme c-type cytochrome [Methanohalobium sp.]|uniref:methanogenesis multiheme c-type cytochrome n=1 Tax=Methanohalobium sp. TaxID=2837493 RepID=UPI00397A57D1